MTKHPGRAGYSEKFVEGVVAYLFHLTTPCRQEVFQEEWGALWTCILPYFPNRVWPIIEALRYLVVLDSGGRGFESL